MKQPGSEFYSTDWKSWINKTRKAIAAGVQKGNHKNRKEKGSQNRVKHQLLYILDIKSIDFSVIPKNKEALSVQNH